MGNPLRTLVCKIISKIIMRLCHIQYKYYCTNRKSILYINGIGEHYPRALVYSEKEDIRERINRI